MDIKHRHLTTPIKSALLKKGWGDAIDLLDCLIKNNEEGFLKWVKTKSTIDLMKATERFRDWSLYDQRNDPCPFDNDVYALDAVLCSLERAYTLPCNEVAAIINKEIEK